jgi:hypothetical protein
MAGFRPVQQEYGLLKSGDDDRTLPDPDHCRWIPFFAIGIFPYAPNAKKYFRKNHFS